MGMVLVSSFLTFLDTLELLPQGFLYGGFRKDEVNTHPDGTQPVIIHISKSKRKIVYGFCRFTKVTGL